MKPEGGGLARRSLVFCFCRDRISDTLYQQNSDVSYAIPCGGASSGTYIDQQEDCIALRLVAVDVTVNDRNTRYDKYTHEKGLEIAEHTYG